MPLPVNIQPGQSGHAAMHNATNTVVNQLETAVNAITSEPSPYVNVVTGNEPRPVVPIAIWVGGTTRPTNSVAGDVWYAVGATAPGSDTTPPTTPTSVGITEQTETSFRVTWTASTDDVGVTGYGVQVDGAELLTSATTLVVTGKAAGTTYPVRVRARDAAGNWSALSAAVNATTSAASGGGGAEQHSVFDGTNTPSYASYNDGGTLRVSTGFYTFGASPVQRVVGMRIFKVGSLSSSGTAIVSLPVLGQAPNLASPTQSKAYTGLINGWNNVFFDTPITLPLSTPVWVGYQSSDGSYSHAAIAGAPITAPDGSQLALMDDAASFAGNTLNRAYFIANGGSQAVGASAPSYGIDIITDEGP